MGTYRGEGIAKLNGQELYYSFGINATRLWCELTGKTMQDLLSLFSGADEATGINDVDLADMVFAGLAAGSRIKNGTNLRTPKFSREDVADWIERADEKDLAPVIDSLHKSLMTPKQLEVYEAALANLEKSESKKKAKEATSKTSNTSDQSDTDSDSTN